MSENIPLRLLSELVEAYDERERAVPTDELARRVEGDPETVARCLASLQRSHLVQDVEDRRYRPTVTARELLQLDIADDDLVVLDIAPAECDI